MTDNTEYLFHYAAGRVMCTTEYLLHYAAGRVMCNIEYLFISLCSWVCRECGVA